MEENLPEAPLNSDCPSCQPYPTLRGHLRVSSQGSHPNQVIITISHDPPIIDQGVGQVGPALQGGLVQYAHPMVLQQIPLQVRAQEWPQVGGVKDLIL